MKTDKVFVILLLGLFMISLASAWEFDNVKRYDDINKKVTIKNGFGLGSDIAEAKLNTPLNNKVALGYQKVAEFEVTSYKDYENALGNMDFYDVNDNMKKITREFDYKFLDNGEWKNLDNLNFKKGDFKIIGIFTEVQRGDVVEWIPTFHGKIISEWAIWTQSLNADIVAYYKLDETSGLVAPDSTDNGYDGTLINMEGDEWITNGKINGAIEFNNTADDTEFINVPDNADFDALQSISFWVNITDVTSSIAGRVLIEKDSDFTGVIGYISDTNSIVYHNSSATRVIDIPGLTTNVWHNIIMIYDGVNNITIYIDGEQNKSSNLVGSAEFDNSNNFTIGGSLTATRTPWAVIDEVGVWKRVLTNEEIIQLYNEGTGISFQSTIFTILNSPDNLAESINRTIDFSCSVNTTNSTFLVANNSLIINNVIDQTNSSGIKGNYTFTKTFSSKGTFFWTCQAVADNQVNNTGGNRTLIIKNIIENSQTFNNITTEGATETFTINFTKTSELQVSTVDLIYNGTLNSFAYSVSGDEVFSTGSISIPTVTSDTNVTFNWNITFDDGSISNSQTNNQTILNVNVDDCSVFTNIIYNFTQYDEENQTILSGNNTIELQINLFNLAKTTVLVNFSDSFTGVNPVQFCAEDAILPTVNYSSYVIVKYFVNSSNQSQSTSYSVEYHNILNQTISNTTIPIDIPLFNLKASDTTKFRLTFRDGEFVLAPNILVQVHRQYIADNDFKIVEIPITDSNGQTVLNLVKDVIIYNFIMVNEAREVVGTFNSIAAFCSDFLIGDCTINLAPDSLSEQIYDYNEEFDVSISRPSYDNTTERISISFVTGDLTPANLRMDIVRNNNFGNRSVCSDTLFSASGTLSCDVSAITNTDQFLFVSTLVEDSLAKRDTINLNADILNFGTLNGATF